MKQKAIFLDRDGVIIEDTHLITNLSQVKIIKGAADAIHKLQEKGYLIFIVTNQTVVARGMISLTDVLNLHEKIIEHLRHENGNIIITKTYLCPHHPNATDPDFRKACSCRKPKAGMILKAAQEYDIDLKKSYMIGDRVSDICAGNLAGCTTLQITSEKSSEKPIESDLEYDSSNLIPNHKIKHLSETIQYV